MKPYFFHREAETDLAAAIEHYCEESPALAERFKEAIEDLLIDVCSAPQRFRVIDPPVRRHFGRTFPYAILYADQGDYVLVLAISHFKRRPGYWGNRRGGT